MMTMASANATWASCGVGMRYAHRVDAGLTSAAVGIDLDEATIGDVDGGALEPERLGVGPAADGHDDRVDVDRLAVAELDRGPGSIHVGRVALHGDAGAHVDVATLERALDDPGDVVVAARRILGRASRIVTCEPMSAK